MPPKKQLFGPKRKRRCKGKMAALRPPMGVTERIPNGVDVLKPATKETIEEKSSDEDSIHLVLEEDERDSNGISKDVVTNDDCDLNEDEILNKYETTNGNTDTAPIDINVENSLLESNDQEENVDKENLLKEQEKDTKLAKQNEDIPKKPSTNEPESKSPGQKTTEVDEPNIELQKPIKEAEAMEVQKEKEEATQETEMNKSKESDEEFTINEDHLKAIVPIEETKEDQSEKSEEMQLVMEPKSEASGETSEIKEEDKLPSKVEEPTKIDPEEQSKETETVSFKEVEEKDNESQTKSVEVTLPPDSDSSNKENHEKCEKFNGTNKYDGDDLLDISIIRDADEDNASAIEENKEYIKNTAGSDKSSDNDDDGSNDKTEMDEGDEHMEDDQAALGESMDIVDEEVQGGTDAHLKSEMTDENSTASGEECANKTTCDKGKTDEFTKLVCAESDDSDSDNDHPLSSRLSKRSLPKSDDDELLTKKIKLANEYVKKEYMKKVKLNTFADFMRDKTMPLKLTRSDLEQFCIQKLCEALIHRTPEGDAFQKLKQQEQIIDNLRKDVQQLLKQTRDLEIVNKKLTTEVKTLIQTNGKGPIIPMKITRSVGLQVKVPDAGRKRNFQLTPPKMTPAPTYVAPTTTNNHVKSPVNAARKLVPMTKQTPSPQNKAIAPPTTPLLSQALTNRRTTPTAAAAANSKRPLRQIQPKMSPEANKASGGASVIDLTDEDDKKPAITTNKVAYKTFPKSTIGAVKNMATQKNTSTQKNTITPQKPNTGGRPISNGLSPGVRLATTKNGSLTLPPGVVPTSTTPVMYVVQPTTQSSISQGIVTTSTAAGQKAVIVNFQTPNGVLASSLNSQAVSVIPKPSIASKASPVARHPAPLPKAPLMRLNGSNDSSLKPLLPKPHLSIRKTDTGIILQWKMPYNLNMYESIASYQLYAYQETNAAPSTEMWRKVGDVKALALPMACTLTQFADKNKYYFAVRSVDVHKRIGAFSEPEEISL